MENDYFSGSYVAKLDEKNRFVLPQDLRYQLVEKGKLEFIIALSMGGCLAIYRESEMQEILGRLKKKQHIARFQRFLTLFFSTLIKTTCDKVGRVTIPAALKNGVGIEQEMMITGALNKIELWPREVYEKDLRAFMEGKESLKEVMEDAFSQEEKKVEDAIDRVQREVVKL